MQVQIPPYLHCSFGFVFKYLCGLHLFQHRTSQSKMLWQISLTLLQSILPLVQVTKLSTVMKSHLSLNLRMVLLLMLAKADR